MTEKVHLRRTIAHPRAMQELQTRSIKKEEAMLTTLRWYGHAAIGIDTSGYQLLVDPFFTGNTATTQKPEEVAADYLLITHGHGDHVGDAPQIARRTGATIISNAEICTWFAKQGLKTHAQHLGGGFHYPFGYLKMTYALHGSALPDGSYGGNPGGFLLTTLEGKKIYLAGDTGLFGDMKLIGMKVSIWRCCRLAIITPWDRMTRCWPCGCCAQKWWCRFTTTPLRSSARTRPPGQKEFG